MNNHALGYDILLLIVSKKSSDHRSRLNPYDISVVLEKKLNNNFCFFLDE